MAARSSRGALLLLMSAAACAEDPPADLVPYEGEALAGGDTTVFDDTRLAYATTFRNLDRQQRGDHFVGNSFFNQNWVSAPASTDGRDGLGPLFNARSCSGCHFRDGRGRPPEPGEPAFSMLVRLGVPGVDSVGGPRPEPVYGDQLQPSAVLEVPTEGQVTVTYEDVDGAFGDGTLYTLRRPTLVFSDLGYGPMAADTMVSPRVAPAVYGLGLLEAIAEADLLALADPDDLDGDGISGRPNHPFDPVTGGPALGRFGWKANQVGVAQQNAGAFLGDMGLTTPLHGAESCSAAQEACLGSPSGGAPEVDQRVMDFVDHYVRTLAVPARRDVDDPTVLVGREAFEAFGCASCHVPSFLTASGRPDLPQVGEQLIWPYTDLLLHDMGPDLADGRPDFEASGQEWRTPPLWGIGLLEVVNEHDAMLHDGRARGFAEAILWHGGEAESSAEQFRNAPAPQRDALIRFLESL